MALGYAEKLSFKADVGKLGLPEVFDSAEELRSKVEVLAQLIRESKHFVVFTGAGISTSCGIPDFRGPKGIWTLQHEGKDLPKADVAFCQARPGLTHMALVQLVRANILKFIISQNIDGLHLRSGIPREQLSELHGNSFMETCSVCDREYLRDFEMETIGEKPTGRRCFCGGKLVDTIVDWEGALPPVELQAAEKHCKKADLIVCLGTSLQITPACNLPLKTVKGGGKLVIVNLQATPKDKKATLLIHGRVDEIMAGVMKILNQSIPPFIRVDRVVVNHSFSRIKKEKIKSVVRISSPHGPKAPLPFIQSLEVSCPEVPELDSLSLQQPPYVFRREISINTIQHLKLRLKLVLADGCMCRSVEISHPVHFEEKAEKDERPLDGRVDLLKLQHENVDCGRVLLISKAGAEAEYGVVTSVVHYTCENKESLKQEVDNKEPLKREVDDNKSLKREVDDDGQTSDRKRCKQDA